MIIDQGSSLTAASFLNHFKTWKKNQSKTKKYFFLLNNNKINILKQIAWETQKLHSNFSRSKVSWVFDQNMENIVQFTSLFEEFPLSVLYLFTKVC